MSKHTPGPWVVIPLPTKECKYSVATDNSAPVQAVVADMHAGSINCPPDVMEANARLISAAPDLLAALDGMLRALSAEQRDARARVELSSTAEAKISARAAIAKAKGE